MVQPGIYGCQIGWESIGLAVWKMAFMPCQFFLMAIVYGPVISVHRSPLDV